MLHNDVHASVDMNAFMDEHQAVTRDFGDRGSSEDRKILKDREDGKTKIAGKNHISYIAMRTDKIGYLHRYSF